MTSPGKRTGIPGGVTSTDSAATLPMVSFKSTYLTFEKYAS